MLVCLAFFPHLCGVLDVTTNHEIDKDRNGSIDVKEMREALRIHGVNLGLADARRLFKASVTCLVGMSGIIFFG